MVCSLCFCLLLAVPVDHCPGGADDLLGFVPDVHLGLPDLQSFHTAGKYSDDLCADCRRAHLRNKPCSHPLCGAAGRPRYDSADSLEDAYPAVQYSGAAGALLVFALPYRRYSRDAGRRH
ncbi:hypothetical protein D3C81_1829320 [compost metagenome]